MEETERFDTGELTRPVDPGRREGDRARWLGALLVAVVVIGAVAAWFAWMRRAEPPPAPPVAQAPVAPAVAPQPNLAPAVRHPVEAIAPPAEEAAKPLPALAESDPALHDAASSLLSAGTFEALFYPDRVVRRFVATVDNLPRQTLAADLRPVRPAPGTLAVIGPPDARQIGLDNGARYDAYVRALGAVDSRQLVATYVHFYPLFQQAYRELGYPNGYFNDRLVDVIDNVLATPTIDGPIALAQPKVLYEYADPSLQSLSAGQKALLRMGPENAAKVKAKLREIRRLIVAQKPNG